MVTVPTPSLLTGNSSVGHAERGKVVKVKRGSWLYQDDSPVGLRNSDSSGVSSALYDSHGEAQRRKEVTLRPGMSKGSFLDGMTDACQIGETNKYKAATLHLYAS